MADRKGDKPLSQRFQLFPAQPAQIHPDKAVSNGLCQGFSFVKSQAVILPVKHSEKPGPVLDQVATAKLVLIDQLHRFLDLQLRIPGPMGL